MSGTRDQIANEVAQLESRLAALDHESTAVREKLTVLRRQLTAPAAISITVPSPPPSTTPTPTTQADKFALFASLVRGRVDVYPRNTGRPGNRST